MSTTQVRPAATYPTIVGTVIAQLRRGKGLQQKDFADQVGVTQSTWSRVESGQSGLSIEQLAAAARILGLRPGEILAHADRAAAELKKRGVRVQDNRPGSALADGLVFIGVAALVIAVLAALSGRKR